MKKTPHYTIFHSELEKGLHLINSFENRKDCTLVEYKYRGDKNPILKIIRKIHTSYRLNKILHLPFRYIWYNFCYKKFDNPENEIVLIHTPPFYWFDFISFYKKWQKRGIKTYVVFVDSVETNYPSAKILKDVMKVFPKENIISYDLSDCKKYGFHYLNECYYDAEIPKKKFDIEYDVYLAARIKPGRAKIINNLYKSFKKHDIKARFDIVADPKYDKWYYDNPTLDKEINILKSFLKYEEVIENTMKSNCILEVSQEGQNAPSLRYFEAVEMNKKLLTNVKT